MDRAATAKSAMEHLTQRELSQHDRDVLAGLQHWLSQAEFKDDGEGGDMCVDKQLGEKWTLLCATDLVKQVWASFLVKSILNNECRRFHARPSK